ncbi:peptidase [Sphingomonas endophytica]|uniref:peptidase n=1 Tax=Sphingomonas endophytica TaxID=869719 RepID=UPI000A839DD8|nr:peptidase [Sphingomonas endophytica]
MFVHRMTLAALLGGLLLGTSACTGGYGYSGVSVGAGSGFYDDPYYAAGYAPGYYGWYDNYYYPGTGAYVYDRYRRAYPWNDGQRRYWQQRRNGYADRDVRANWRDFGRDVRRERRDYRGDIRVDRQALRDGRITREQFRAERRDARREYRQDVRRDYRDLRRANRAQGARTPRPDGAFRPRPRR